MSGWFDIAPGGWFCLVPLVSLIACAAAILFTCTSFAQKLKWCALTLVGAFLQFVFNVAFFGWLALKESGLEGVQ